MSYLTISKYKEKTKLALTGVNSGYIDSKLEDWSMQIDELTGNTFEATTTPTTLTVQSNGIFKFGGWQEEGLIISTKSGFLGSYTPLNETNTVEYTYPSFRTKVNGIEVANPVIGIKVYANCYASCSDISTLKVEGLRYWSDGLPGDLMNILYELVENLLDNDERAYDSGMLPAAKMQKHLSNERDQTRSVSWNRDAKHLENQMKKLRGGVNHSDYTSTLGKYFNTTLKNGSKFGV